MKNYIITVYADIHSDFEVEAEDEIAAMSLAEKMFTQEYTCISGGLDVGFDWIEAVDWSENESDN